MSVDGVKSYEKSITLLLSFMQSYPNLLRTKAVSKVFNWLQEVTKLQVQFSNLKALKMRQFLKACIAGDPSKTTLISKRTVW